MKKAFKITGIIIGILAIIIVGFVIIFSINLKRMYTTVLQDISAVTEIDLSQVDDGVYSGHYSLFVVSVTLEVTVNDHKIESIDITKQSSGKGYQGRAIIQRVLDQQSVKVDTSTGATGSSSVILIAIDRALKKQN